MRSRDGAGRAAAGPAAAFEEPEDQTGMHAAAALVDCGELGGAETADSYFLNFLHDAAIFHGDLGRASAATEGIFSFNASHGALAAIFHRDPGRAAATEGEYLFTTMHDTPNSSGLGADAATAGTFRVSAATEGEFLFNALHGTLNSLGLGADAFPAGAFRLHDFEGHGQAASVLGDTGSAFSSSDCLIRDSCSNSFHPIHACAHSCLDRCGEGVGVCGVGVACPLSSLCVSRVGDDEDDACMDGSNSLIQGSGCHATACACSDALQNSRQVRGHCLRGGTKCTSTGTGAKVWLSDEIKGFLISSEARKFAC